MNGRQHRDMRASTRRLEPEDDVKTQFCVCVYFSGRLRVVKRERVFGEWLNILGGRIGADAFQHTTELRQAIM